MQKLGYGHFSTAWLALDTKFGNYVAIKVQKSDSNYIDAAYDEVEILQELGRHNFDKDWIKSLKEYFKDEPEVLAELETAEHSQCVQLLNSFIYHGQNGRHFCMVFEIMGVTLLELIKRYNYKGIPLPYIRIITKQMLIGLDFLHRICHIIHTDLKPENVLVCLTKDELTTIQETGHFDVQESTKRNKNKNKGGKTDKKNKDKDKDDKSNTVNSSEMDTTNATKSTLTGKQLRKKRQRLKKRQIKKFEKMGLSPQEIEKKLMENLKVQKGEESKGKNSGNKLDLDEENIDTDNFDINDILERPRLASEPKININVSPNDKKFVEDEDYEDNPDSLINDRPAYDMDLIGYSKTLQNYIKEKNRILHDESYRKNTIRRNNLLNNAKTEKEKIQIIKKLNEEYNRRGPEITPEINTKICDLGNACWFNHHFSPLIQTRQYRAPEVILGVNYNETTDIWSLACIVFELATGDFLFEPHKGSTYSKNDDHLARFMEVLGKMPKKFALSGAYSKKYFNEKGQLRRIKGLQYYSLKTIMIKKYHFKEKEAQAFSDFLMPMLEYYPEKRASARDLLRHPWLKMPANFDYLMSDIEIEKMNMIEMNFGIEKKRENPEEDINKSRDVYSSDSELYKADDEDNNLGDVFGISDEEDDSGDDNPDKIQIANFNNSFCEYGQFVDLTTLDRANPQFDKIMQKKD